MRDTLRVQYRALEGTNTKTRRLAYLTVIVSSLRRESLSLRQLLTVLGKWDKDHPNSLQHYYLQTGELTFTKQQSAISQYLDLAIKLGIATSLAGVYRNTRTGLVIGTLVEPYRDTSNPFFLTTVERLFYTYQILKSDADILLTIVDQINKRPDITLSELQDTFQNDFLNRLKLKVKLCRDELVRRQLLDRINQVNTEWKNPKKYAEHIVPPRLNWLLDLLLLDVEKFKKHQYSFSDGGQLLFSVLPTFDEFTDVVDDWIDNDFWKPAAKAFNKRKSWVDWQRISDLKRRDVLGGLLSDTFKAFRYTFVPKVSASQALLYLSIRLIIDHGILASPACLSSWLSSSQVMNGRVYALRYSARENESYLLATTV
ncbi:MAG TPA: hypothetical protein VGW12_07680 [Pyrinomonadaceae bacterium]|nr:hypothetical protein [Pyrinomonadaceae bacterium]